jgi:hypothetical protein
MKIIAYTLTVLSLTFLLAAGCKKEAKLTPSEGEEKVYNGHSLPQGNHPYDADIVSLFEKYNSIFLYKYVPRDLYYNINTYIGGTYNPTSDSTTLGGYFDVPADQAYVGVQLNLLKEIWLNYYPDTLLKQGMPQKVFLLDSFYNAYPGPGRPADNYPTLYNVFQGGDYMLVTWGGIRLNTISAQDKYTLKGAVNALFLKIAHASGTVTRSSSFTALTNYSAVNYTNYYDYGIIDYYRKDVESDWDAYVEAIVSNSYTTLTSPGNILAPDVDTKGIIQLKYNVVIAYFQSAFGVDLQAIGNAGS